MCVMRAVDPDGPVQKRGQRSVGKAVKPSRPHSPGDTSCKGVRRSVGHGCGEGGSGESGICLLMRPAESRCREGNGPAIQFDRHTAIIQRRPANICSHDAKRRANRSGMILQRGARIIFLCSGDAGNAWTHDAGLLLGDAGNFASEEMLMVARNRGDHGRGGSVQHIG